MLQTMSPQPDRLIQTSLLQSLAPVYYFFCTRITDNFIINFVVTTVFIVMEFWYTKNIVGRRLTGMRWWQVPSTDKSGTTWRFEHRAIDQVCYCSWTTAAPLVLHLVPLDPITRR
jgi:hypothetical protein